jgi:glycosyltransferase involved in cell wall biosynthesis
MQAPLTSHNHTQSPLVSVGMLAYNDQLYIALAIEDILSQSFGNFELIISDDCSVDQTAEICEKYAQKDSRIRFFHQQSRLGMQKNYEFVLAQARGQFFMWGSSDDRWDKDFISVLLDVIRQDKNLISVFCPFQFIDEGGNVCVGKLEGIHINDYSGVNALSRLTKFSFSYSSYSDAFFYGLHRRELIQNIRIPVWWGINSTTPANNNYPVLCFFLARGGYLNVGKSPLFYKRVHQNSKPRHSNEFAGRPLVKHLAFLMRKLNVFYESIFAVQRGSRSLLVVIAVVPLFLSRCLYDCILETWYVLYRNARKLLRLNRNSQC